jgi:hypothetical protein
MKFLAVFAGALFLLPRPVSAQGETAAVDVWLAIHAASVSMQGCVISHAEGPCTLAADQIGTALEKHMASGESNEGLGDRLRAFLAFATRAPSRPIPVPGPTNPGLYFDITFSSGTRRYAVENDDAVALYTNAFFLQLGAEDQIRCLTGVTTAC